ncbi:MAG: hypothetical protein M3548_02450, partial [Actinomycetota bacterium]|nr:hypothetical protein [Actinomycetota bacterium]
MSDMDTAPTGTDTDPGRTKRVRRLSDELAEARNLHALTTDPLLAVVRLERLRVSVTRSLWFFLACGLGFTTTGVQAFLADGRSWTDPVWWGAWLVEPAFAGILITVLRWEADMLARGLIITARAVTKLKRVLLGATLFMNVYPTFDPPQDHTFSLGTTFVHLVIPVVVFFIAEVMPVIQEMCTQAKNAVDTAASPTTPPPAAPVPGPAAGVPP